jgi:hypothetical protein
MNILKTFKRNELLYDNTTDGSSIIKIEINSDFIKINFGEIINSQFQGGNVKNDFDRLKNHLKVGISLKAPCGGFANFYKVISKSKNEYIVFSGVKEVSNSHFVVTVHAIISL